MMNLESLVEEMKLAREQRLEFVAPVVTQASDCHMLYADIQRLPASKTPSIDQIKRMLIDVELMSSSVPKEWVK